MPPRILVPRRRTDYRQNNDATDGRGGTFVGTIDSTLPRISPASNYLRSISGGRSGMTERRIEIAQLRALADTPPAQACINHIVDGVIAMGFQILPPPELKQDPDAIKIARQIEKDLRKPNLDDQKNWSSFVCAVVTDMLINNVAAIERQFLPQAEGKKAIWLWAVDNDRIELNLDWTPQNSDKTPHYYDRGHKGTNKKDWVPLNDSEMFLVERYANSYRKLPPSAVELTYLSILNWLGLNNYQGLTTSKAHNENLIDLGPTTDEELEQFRMYFKYQVMGKGETPIIGTKGQGLKVVKIGASDDTGLYLKYEEKLLRAIALAFKLSARDVNLQEPDNKATAGVAADASFQKAIWPAHYSLIEVIQSEVLDITNPGYTIRAIDSEPRNEEGECDTVTKLFDSGVITRNEARARVGEDPLVDDRGGQLKTEVSETAEPIDPALFDQNFGDPAGGTPIQAARSITDETPDPWSADGN
jgi:hypothetical protein